MGDVVKFPGSRRGPVPSAIAKLIRGTGANGATSSSAARTGSRTKSSARLDRDAVWDKNQPTKRSARLRLYRRTRPEGDCLIWTGKDQEVHRDDWSRTRYYRLAHELRTGKRLPSYIEVQRTCGNACLIHTVAVRRGVKASVVAEKRRRAAVSAANRRRVGMKYKKRRGV